MPVDEELKTAVKNAKGKRSYFAFIQKGASDGALLVGKSKIPDKEIAAAKKKSGGSTTLKGACFGEGEKLIFEMAKDPPEKLEDALNKVIKRDAGISVDSLCRRGNAPDLVDGNASGDSPYGVQIPVPESQYGVEQPVSESPYGVQIPVPDQTSPNQPSSNPPGGPEPDDYNNDDYNNLEQGNSSTSSTVQNGNATPVQQSVKQQPPVTSGPTSEQIYYQKRQAVEPKLKDGLKQQRGDSAKLKEVFKYAEGCAQKKEFDKGIQGLDSLAGMLAKPSPPALTDDQRKEYFKRRKPIEPRLLTALKAGLGKLGQRLATTFKVAEGKAKKEDFSIAIEALGMVENLLRGVGVNPQGQANGSNGGPPNNAPQSNGPPSNSPQSNDADYNIVNSSTAEEEGLKQQELNNLLDANMDPEQLASEMAMQIDEIETEWSKNIDLTNAKVDFPSDAKHGSFGKLGFIETGDPNTPKLVVKVPLREAGSADLQREAEMYRKVGEHPNIAKCMGVTQVDGHRGLVMENIEGDNVTKSMAKITDAYKTGKISHEEYWGIVQFTMREMLKGMAQMEQAGIVHNDIRGDNIMIDQNTGGVKIIDFGLAVESGNPAPNFPIKSGTTSPDVISSTGGIDGPVTPKHDAFAVGSMTFKAGEGRDFDYNQPYAAPREKLPAFASFAPEDATAIRPGDDQTKAAVKNADGTYTKTPGRTAATTAYTEFVNKMMDPDPTKRLSPADALNDPFLADSPLDDEAAAKLISSLMTTGTNPNRNTGPDPNNPKHPRPMQQPGVQPQPSIPRQPTTQQSSGQESGTEEEGTAYNSEGTEGSQNPPPQQNRPQGEHPTESGTEFYVDDPARRTVPPRQNPPPQNEPEPEGAPYN